MATISTISRSAYVVTQNLVSRGILRSSFRSPKVLFAVGYPSRNCPTPSLYRWASSVTPNSSTRDPAETEALLTLEEGTRKLEEGDVEGARALYQRSVDVKRNASNLFNLGVTKYHAKDFDGAIENWKESIELQPDSPDAHTNLASAYIMNPVPRPQLALQHLRIAVQLSPQDPEIAFNLAAVLEACGQLEESLKYYTLSKENGVERAAVHIRNVSAKILGQRAKAQATSEDGSKDNNQ